GCGTVFRLTPPQPGQTVWKETVLYNFKGPDGVFPQGGVIKDAVGSLYGTASGGGQNGNGLAFKLSPPLPGQTRWSETVLHQFHVSTSGDTPIGELVADTAGSFFGTAYSGGAGLSGTVFKIAP
ncbi:MAG TPA: choice-of-anchor tandem repeat GloVer-containing protein, partial [Verrucomicrobiae bacterium]|nr:choice-of-anchor tandem repeat GloVer-containing protein [Verrucomicrobiae bacterium]